jgi:formate dehydrogenase subunit gamma
MLNEVEKYRKPIRVLHWIHSAAFVLLFLTGLVLFIPSLGFLAEDSWTRLIHRIAAIIFVLAPVIYIILDPKAAGRGLKMAFTWGAEDLGWLKAAPACYFLSDESAMPPQGCMNAGQKMWWFIIIVFGVVFLITGAILWFARELVPVALAQWMVFIHDVSFIITGTMFFVHLYLGVFHPMMTESWKAITTGKISAEYARTHHGKWYEEISRDKKEQA